MSSAGLDIALVADQYLRMRRAMGYKLLGQGRLLLEFARFFQNTGAEHVSIAVVLDWVTLPADADRTWWYARLGAVRPFAQILQAFDPQTQVPEASMIQDGDHRARPYIFSEAELARLLEAANKLHPAFGALAYRTYISLVAVTGMRRSEATHLDRTDLDWENGALTIRETKFHKSRRLPLHPSTITALGDYARQLDREFGTTEQPAFFLSSRGTRLRPNTAGHVLAGLVQAAGLPRLEKRHQHRLHDTHLRSGRCRAGTNPVPRSALCCPCYQPISVTKIRMPPIGICSEGKALERLAPTPSTGPGRYRAPDELLEFLSRLKPPRIMPTTRARKPPKQAGHRAQVGIIRHSTYADDAVVHCTSESRAREVLSAIAGRMGEQGLRLHPEKTGIGYCKDGK